MNINYYKKYEPIDGKWYFVKELGSGAFGTVFEVERRDFNHAKSAMKIISIPSSSNEVNSYREENYDLDEKSISSYFYGFVEEFTAEFKLMSKLRGNSNIVSIEDYDVKEHEDEIGWDIFIRMELLTPINKYFKEHGLNQRDVIKLGIDICKALEVCQKYKIIHRDIKPSNIFVSDTGEFKLGDFGVARTLEKTASGLSKKGTYTYMAPEVFKGERYSSNIDIYSLGIVMYKLLNNNFEPFRTERTHTDEENALACRMRGENIPVPANADGRLAEIILKACAFNPKERYESPLQMRNELQNIIYSESEAKIIYPNGDEMDYEASTTGKNDSEQTVSIFSDQATVKENQNKTVGFFDEQTASEEDESETVGIFDSKKTTANLKERVQNQAEAITENSFNAGSESTPKKKDSLRKKKIVISSIIAICILIVLGIFFALSNSHPSSNKNYSDDYVDLIDNYTNEIKFTNENGDTIISSEQIVSVESEYSKENDSYYIILEFSTYGIEVFKNACQNNIGQTLSIYIGDELITAPMISESMASLSSFASTKVGPYNKDDISGILRKIGISNEKTVNATAVAKDFAAVKEFVESVKANEQYLSLNTEVNTLVDIIAKHQDDIANGKIDDLSDYEDCINNMHPAWESLSTAMYNLSQTTIEPTTTPEATEIPAQDEKSQETVVPAKNTSQTNKTSRPQTQTQAQPQTRPQQQTQSQEQTPTQPQEQTPTQEKPQEQPPQSAPQEQQNAVCPVCGSKYHSVHPSSNAPTITKDFD